MEFRGRYNYYLDFPGALVVCEPLTKRYTAIPRPRNFDTRNCQYQRSYLLDGGVTNEAGSHIGMSNFRVLFELYRGSVAHATIFTAGGDASSWTEKAIDDFLPVIDYSRRVMGHAAGSWYFYMRDNTSGVVLDGGTGEYTSFELPNIDEDWDLHNKWNHRFYVCNGYDGKPRLLSLSDSTTLRIFAKLDDSDNHEWVLENRITLLETVQALLGDGYEPACPWIKLLKNVRYKLTLTMSTRGSGFVILLLHPDDTRLFSVDLKTMEVKPAKGDLGKIMYPSELPWPPALHTVTDV